MQPAISKRKTLDNRHNNNRRQLEALFSLGHQGKCQRAEGADVPCHCASFVCFVCCLFCFVYCCRAADNGTITPAATIGQRFVPFLLLFFYFSTNLFSHRYRDTEKYLKYARTLVSIASHVAISSTAAAPAKH